MAQLAKCLSDNYEDLRCIPGPTLEKNDGAAACTSGPKAGDAETGESLGLTGQSA